MYINEKNVVKKYYNRELKCIEEKDFENLMVDLRAYFIEKLQKDAFKEFRKKIDSLIPTLKGGGE